MKDSHFINNCFEYGGPELNYNILHNYDTNLDLFPVDFINLPDLDVNVQHMKNDIIKISEKHHILQRIVNFNQYDKIQVSKQNNVIKHIHIIVLEYKYFGK
jgi:hypothetical protein